MNVIYIYNSPSSFVEKDIEILKSRYQVEVIQISIKKKWLLPFKYLYSFGLFAFARKNSVIVHQFGGYHVLPAIFASKFRKHKTVVVLGGTDCVSFPSIDYGNFSRSILGKATGIGLKNADLLLPVDESLIHYAYSYQPNDHPFQGYKAYVKNIRTTVKVIYNGYNSEKFTDLAKPRKKNTFVTICANISSRFAFQLKGIDLIYELAQKMPDAEFHIIGGESVIYKPTTTNVFLHPLMPNDQLPEALNNYEYYLQLSMSEGFPNALCEGMLSGCIPVGSNVGGIPYIIQETGLILYKKTELDTLIQRILRLTAEEKNALRTAARLRITKEFPLERREHELVDAINSLIN